MVFKTRMEWRPMFIVADISEYSKLCAAGNVRGNTLAHSHKKQLQGIMHNAFKMSGIKYITVWIFSE